MRRRRSLLLGWLLLVLLPALACNLPARQRPELVFPTGQALPSLTASLPIPTSQPALVTSPPTTAAATSTPPPPATSPPDLFPGLQTATPGPGQPGAWITSEAGAVLPPFGYWTQPGDSLPALAGRFGVPPEQISAAESLPAAGYLPPGLLLSIPNLLGQSPYPSALLPDSMVVYSPAAAGFDVAAFTSQTSGYLSTYSGQVEPGDLRSGAQIVQLVAAENSVNPQLLLAFLEFRSHWVLGQPRDPLQYEYPIGFYVPDYRGLYLELSLAAKHLNIGYYGWRQGSLVDLTFADSSRLRISPGLNPGTAALMHLTAMFYRQQSDWLEALYGPQGVLAVYAQLFGDPWQAAARVGPLIPHWLSQPPLDLPFAPGEMWSLTAGPHIAWTTGTPRGALDFAPITGEPPCAVSRAWVTASAAGLVVRAERGVIALDLDEDWSEATGWVLVYMHVAEQDRVPLGSRVEAGARLGHPSCEGGRTTGTHVHLARKFNGEWLAADGPLPMQLSGWTAHAGERSYEGSLERDGQVVTAQPDGSRGSTIYR